MFIEPTNGIWTSSTVRRDRGTSNRFSLGAGPLLALADMRQRLLPEGLSLIVPSDGQTLWTLTHNSDFAVGLVGLLGRRQAIGLAFQIVSDEALTWDEIHRQTAAAAGVECRIVHIPTDLLTACRPEMNGRLMGDASVCRVFDNSKIKRFVPEFRPVMPYAQGIKQTIAWYDADPARQDVDTEMDAWMDRLIAVYEASLANAQAAFGR